MDRFAGLASLFGLDQEEPPVEDTSTDNIDGIEPNQPESPRATPRKKQSVPQGAAAMAPYINAAAEKWGVPADLLMAQVHQESGFKKGRTSGAGAKGPAQFIDSTWARYGNGRDVNDPEAAFDAQAHYMHDLLGMFGGDERLALAGYNAGEGAVKKYGGVPPYKETQGYIKNIMGLRGQYQDGTPQAAQAAPQETPQAAPGNHWQVNLSDGTNVLAARGMTLADVAAQLKASGVDAVPIRQVDLPDGSNVMAQFDMPDDQVLAMVQQHAPDAFQTPTGAPPSDETHTGYLDAAKQNLIQSSGTIAKGLGTEVGALGDAAAGSSILGDYARPVGEQLQEWGQQLHQKGAGMEERSAGMFHMPQDANWLEKNLSYPTAQFAGNLLPYAAAFGAGAINPALGTGLGAAAIHGGSMGQLETTAKEAGQPFNRSEALPYALADDVVNYAGLRMLGPLKKIFSEDVILGGRAAIQKAVAEGGMDAAKKVVGTRVGNVLKQLGIAETGTIGGEVAEDMIQRAYTDKPLFNDDAMKQYLETAKFVAPGTGLIGVGQGLGMHHNKATEVARIEEQQAADIAAEQQQLQVANQTELADKKIADKEAKQAKRQTIPIPERLQDLPYREAVRVMEMEAAEMGPPTPTAPIEQKIPSVPLPAQESSIPAQESSIPAVQEPIPAVQEPIPAVQEPIPAQEAQPIPEPTLRSAPMNPADVLELNNRAGLRRQLKGLDVNNVADHPRIEEILTKTVAPFKADRAAELQRQMAEAVTRTQSETSLPTPAVSSETTHADNLKIPATPNVGRSTQPSLRQEGESATISSPRVRESGRKSRPVEEVQPQEVKAEVSPFRERVGNINPGGLWDIMSSKERQAIIPKDLNLHPKAVEAFAKSAYDDLPPQVQDRVFPTLRDQVKVIRKTPVKPLPGFARQTPAGATPLSKPQIMASVKEATQGWKNAPSIQVVKQEQLPQHIREAIGKDFVPGVYDKGTVYMVEGNLHSPAHVQEVLFHESYGHHGLRSMFGPELGKHLNNIYEKIGGEAGLRKYADKYGVDIKAYDEAASEHKPAIRNAILTEELLAHVAQQQPSLRGAIHAAYGAIRAGLRKLGLAKLAEYNDADLAHLIRQSKKFVTHGEAPGTATPQAQPMFARQQPTKQEVKEAKEQLDSSGLVFNPKKPGMGQRAAKLYHDLFKEGRNTSFQAEYIDIRAPLNAAVKSLPDTVGGKLRSNYIYSAYEQRHNVNQEAYRHGYVVMDDDGTLGVMRDSQLAPARIYARVGKERHKLFNQVLAASRVKTIREQDRAIFNRANNMLSIADRMETYAEKQTDPARKKKYNNSAKNLRKIADRDLEFIRYDKGRTEFSDADVKAAETILAAEPELAREAQNIYELLRKSVDLWEKEGLIDSKKAQEWRDYPNYFPFQKHEDFEEKMMTPAKHIDEIIKQMGRGTGTIAEIHAQRHHAHGILAEDNLLRHIMFMSSVAAEHSARKNACYNLELVDKARRLPRGATKESGKDEAIVKFRESGHDVHFKVDDPAAYFAMQSAQPILSPLMKRLRSVSNMARGFMIMNPLFWVRQVFREPIQASVVARVGTLTPVDTLAGMASIAKGKSEAFTRLRDKGVVGPVDVIPDPVEFIANAQKGNGAFKQVINNIKRVHEVVDASTRVAIYDKALKQGISMGMDRQTADAFAVMKAREVINFAKQGRSKTIRAIRAVTPFFGASLNSLDVLARAAFPEKFGSLSKATAMDARRMFYSNAAMLTMYTMAYTLAMSDDDDYLHNPDRRGSYLIPVAPNDQDVKAGKIAIAFEAGWFTKELPELLTLYNLGAITGKEAATEGAKGFKNLVLPPAPTIFAIEPLVAAALNHDFFTGTQIESGRDEGARQIDRDRKAGELVKTILRNMDDRGVSIPGLSPDKMEFLMRQYFGQLWAVTRAASDAYLQHGPVAPEKSLADMPLISGVLSKGSRDVALSQFYDVMQQATEVQKSISNAQTTGNAEAFERVYNKAHEKEIVGYESMKPVAKAIGEISTDIEQITNSSDPALTAKQKTAQIRRLKELRNEWARKGLEMAKQLDLDI